MLHSSLEAASGRQQLCAVKITKSEIVKMVHRAIGRKLNSLKGAAADIDTELKFMFDHKHLDSVLET